MIEKYCDSVSGGGDDALDQADAVDLAEYHAALDRPGLFANEALKRVMATSRAAMSSCRQPALGAGEESGAGRN